MRTISKFVLVTLLTTLTGVCAIAQTAPVANTPGSVAGLPVAALPANSATSQAIAGSLANLPDADTLIYINPQRILNEVVPKFMPPKDVEEMRKGFEQAKQMSGVDPTKVEFIVIATRFRKPTDDLNFQLPEFMVVTSGDFSAESLMTLARMASGGKLRDEKYGARTMGLITIEPLLKEAEKNPILKGFAEMGIVMLNGNTIAAGSPGYLRAAVDAADGKDRISMETLNSLVRDPNALVSIAGQPWHSFAKSFGMMGTQTNPRAPRCDIKQGDFYAALTMDATNFMLRGAMNADNPITAKIMSNLFGGFLRQATDTIKDPMAQPLLKGIAIVAEGDEILLRADVPQQMVTEMIKNHMMRHKPVSDGAMKPDEMKGTKPPTKKRRSRRRG